MRQREPIFNAPRVVVALLGAFVALHLVLSFLSYDAITLGRWMPGLERLRSLLPDEAGDRLLELLAFIPARLGTGPAGLTQFVTHVFVHGDLTHLIINSAWFLAFATPIARRVGVVRFLAFFLICGIGGALLYLPGNAAPMVGASGAISGLMGAAIRFIFRPSGAGDGEAFAGDRAPLLSLKSLASDRRALIVIAVWTLLNVLVAWAAPAFLDERSIAWEAHLGGFFTGLLTFGLFDPKPPVHHDSAPAE